jgi:hypothetical protein
MVRRRCRGVEDRLHSRLCQRLAAGVPHSVVFPNIVAATMGFSSFSEEDPSTIQIAPGAGINDREMR